MKIKELPEQSRPRERLMEVGTNNLTNQELWAIIIKNGSINNSVLDVALNILKLLDEKQNYHDVTINDLTKLEGIGVVKAQTIVAVLELSKRLYFKIPKEQITLLSPTKIFEYLRYELHDKKQEYFYCLYFDNRQKLLGKKLHFIGTLNKSLVHPREIFKEAYNLSANSIVCVHNHPSGSLKPSKEDIEITNILIEVGKINGITVSDHVIITNESYFSFYEADLM